MKKLILLFFSFNCLQAISAQDFGTDATSKYILKDLESITPPHEYFQLLNLSNDTVAIRWKVNQALTFYPSQWILAIQDNETYFNPMVDSNDVKIIDSAGTMDKIILNVYTNQTVGYGELVIDLVNLDSTQEVHQIKFEIDIFQDGVGMEESNLFSDFKIYPNPCSDRIFFESGKLPEEWAIYRMDGKCMIEKTNWSQTNLEVGFLENGCYFLQFRSDDGSVHTFPFFKN